MFVLRWRKKYFDLFFNHAWQTFLQSTQQLDDNIYLILIAGQLKPILLFQFIHALT